VNKDKDKAWANRMRQEEIRIFIKVMRKGFFINIVLNGRYKIFGKSAFFPFKYAHFNCNCT
jgi:hypothetical protein